MLSNNIVPPEILGSRTHPKYRDPGRVPTPASTATRPKTVFFGDGTVTEKPGKPGARALEAGSNLAFWLLADVYCFGLFLLIGHGHWQWGSLVIHGHLATGVCWQECLLFNKHPGAPGLSGPCPGAPWELHPGTARVTRVQQKGAPGHGPGNPGAAKRAHPDTARVPGCSKTGAPGHGPGARVQSKKHPGAHPARPCSYPGCGAVRYLTNTSSSSFLSPSH